MPVVHIVPEADAVDEAAKDGEVAVAQPKKKRVKRKANRTTQLEVAPKKRRVAANPATSC